jgi:hypothetical protein
MKRTLTPTPCQRDCEAVKALAKQMEEHGKQLDRIETHLLSQARANASFFGYIERILGLDKQDVTPPQPIPFGSNGNGNG